MSLSPRRAMVVGNAPRVVRLDVELLRELGLAASSLLSLTCQCLNCLLELENLERVFARLYEVPLRGGVRTVLPAKDCLQSLPS